MFIIPINVDCEVNQEAVSSNKSIRKMRDFVCRFVTSYFVNSAIADYLSIILQLYILDNNKMADDSNSIVGHS